ncbi:MAG: hypothetical protein K2L51_01165, partial [Clostridiales bacterium]|nr:hypothetical protein [Clostridiales bacterium]
LYKDYDYIEAPFWNGTELTNKITNADGGKTFTRHAACSSFTHVAASAATCTQEGISREHWVCKLCGKKYADNAGETEITESVTVAARGHNYGEWIDEVAATATQDGAKGHYACSGCHKYFNAEYNEMESIVIPASGSSTPGDGNGTGDSAGTDSGTGNESTGGNGASGNGASGNGASGKQGLGGGAIAGIVIACVVALAAGGFCLWFFLLRKGKQKHRQ